VKQLFISDLHLSEQQLQLEKLFHQFMQSQTSDADELYVLGDLFDVWIGDDVVDAVAKRVITAFKKFSSAGGRLYFFHGNRDFLLGADFAAATGGTILDEPYKITLAGRQALLLHGDTLCTKDIEYMAFRKEVRSEKWQLQTLALSKQERQAIASNMRAESMARGKTLTDEISDVTHSEVIKLMEQSAVSLLIHGHTHRQNRHSLTINHQPAERIVLGDWGETGCTLIVENNHLELHNFSLID